MNTHITYVFMYELVREGFGIAVCARLIFYAFLKRFVTVFCKDAGDYLCNALRRGK